MNRRRLFLGFTIAALAPTLGQAQFTSGSTGSDGALNLTTPGTAIFHPTALNPPPDPAGDNVFNFTTINIGAGVTVVMQAHLLRNKSVIWLATGDVTIAGMLSLSGGNGGSGSGGAVHLIAPTISGNGTIDTDSIGNPDASNGVVQFNATTNTFTGSVAYDTVYYSELYNPPALPAGLPSVRVVSVDNVAAPMYPTA